MGKLNAIEAAAQARIDGTLPTVPGVDEKYLPLIRMHAVYWKYIIPQMGVDTEGSFYGWCPLHDEVKDPKTPSAQFNFQKSFMRCMKPMDERCTGKKRAISLGNLERSITEKLVAAHGAE